MNGIRQFLHRLGALFRRKRLEGELADEIRIHLEMAAEENVAAGMAPDEARLAARRQFGGVEQVKESCRDERFLVWLDQLGMDIRLAARSLVRARGFTATVVIIIALCLAANVVIFSMVDGVLLQPLPFPDSGRLVVVQNNYPKAALLRTGVSVPHYLERRSGIAAFAEAGAIRSDTAYLVNGGALESVEAADVTPSFFRVLGVNAALGRTFTEDEGVEGRDRVAVLSDGFWRDHYNADPSAIGRTIHVYNGDYKIVGVMPPGFHYLSHGARIWGVLSFSADDRKDDMRHADRMDMIARLRPGATIAQAQAQLDSLNERVRKIDPMAEMVRSVGYFSTVSDLHADHVEDYRQTLLLLQAAVIFLLLIGAVNLANLFMVRATCRAKEFSLRQVLGAGRRQLIRALVVEALLLSVAGGAAGLLLGGAALSAWSRFAAGRLPREVTLGLNGTVCMAALSASIALGLVLSLPVVWIAVRGRLAASLAAESRGGTTTRSVHRFRHALIVVQIALAFVLLFGAGLLTLSFGRVLEVRPGFERANVVTGIVTLPWWSTYKEAPRRAALISNLLSILNSDPGTESASVSNGVPFAGRTWVQAWSIVGKSSADDEFIKEGIFGNKVSGGYFSTLGIPLMEGRFLDDDDVRMKRNVCVVDQEFAHRHWPHGGAIGHQITLPRAAGDTKQACYTIVGIVGSVKQNELTDQRAHAAAYFPLDEEGEFVVSVRTRRTTAAAIASLRSNVLRADPTILVYDLKPMALRIDDSLSGRRTTLLLGTLFAGTSLVLAAVGIYGVLSYSVAQRRREIGVRMALGAQPSQILRQFLGLGARLLAFGLPLGALGACVAGRTITVLLFGVAPASPIILAAAAAVLAAVTLPACLLPSRRAAQVTPNEALRAD